MHARYHGISVHKARLQNAGGGGGGEAAFFAKVYCKKDGTPISDGLRDKIVSPISLVDYMFCILCVKCL